MGALHQVAQLAALRLPAKRAGLHQPADCGVFHLRDPLAAPERAGRDQLAAGGICDGDDPFRPGGHGQEPALRLDRDPLAGGHELPALRHPDVCGVCGCADRDQPDDSSARTEKTSGPHFCHCRRKAGNHARRGPQDRPGDATRTPSQPRLHPAPFGHRDRLMDLLRLASDGSRAEKAKEKAATIQALKPAVRREEAVELFRGCGIRSLLLAAGGRTAAFLGRCVRALFSLPRGDCQRREAGNALPRARCGQGHP